MPSFDISSELDMVALKNAIDAVDRVINNRFDFKGTSAKVDLNEKDETITLHGDSNAQLDQIKDILFPALEKKEADSSKRLESGDVQKVSGNKV
ncbi:MAG: nucleotide-binding protein, partial [Burkholderiales bacterium]|nr:nucleotide-binding protein [Burkholderiales bacterium]